MQAVVQHRRGIPLGPGARREVPGLCRVRRANGGAVALAYSPAMPETPPNPGSDPLPQARPGARRLRTAAALAGLLAVALARPRPPRTPVTTPACARPSRMPSAAASTPPRTPALRGHPAFGWVEYAALQRDLDTLAPQRGLDFLARYHGQAVAGTFRRQWLASLGRRGDWTTFRSAWDEAVDDTALRCYSLQARNAAGTLDEASVQAARAIWIAGDGSLPAACDPVFAALDARGALGPALRWERLEKAAAAWEPGVMRVAARGLPEPERALAEDYAAFVESVHERALASGGAVDGRVLQRGCRASAWPRCRHRPTTTACTNGGCARRWRAATTGGAGGDPQHGPAQREDSRWRYFEARLRERSGEAAEARRAVSRGRRAPRTFHGFLAADRIDAPYALCPLEVQRDLALRRDVAPTRRWCGPSNCSGWTAPAGRRANGTRSGGLDDAERLEAVRLARASAGTTGCSRWPRTSPRNCATTACASR
jgi:soluble lytic murein transglycosylase